MNNYSILKAYLNQKIRIFSGYLFAGDFYFYLHMKDKNMTLNWLLMILISTLVSCQKNKKFQWQPGISPPKYYPISESTIDFGNAGNGSRMPFDNGWGNQYGFVIGERYKEIPEEVSVKYNSSAENYLYQGNIKLPQEKILELFRKYDTGNEAFNAYLIVGMAPGGNVRVWFNTPYSDIQNIEIAKAQLKGHYDETADERYKTKNLENWGKYYTYWQNHGIPYDVWKENEKEYNLHFDFEKPNTQKVIDDYISKVISEGHVRKGPYMTLGDCVYCKLDDAIIIQRLDGEFVTFLEHSLGGVAKMWDQI